MFGGKSMPQSFYDVVDWLHENDPELASQLGNMTIPAGGNMICEKYGITEPKGSDPLDDSMKNILKELKAHAERD